MLKRTMIPIAFFEIVFRLCATLVGREFGVFMEHTREVTGVRTAKSKYYNKEFGWQMPIWNPVKYYKFFENS